MIQANVGGASAGFYPIDPTNLVASRTQLGGVDSYRRGVIALQHWIIVSMSNF